MSHIWDKGQGGLASCGLEGKIVFAIESRHQSLWPKNLPGNQPWADFSSACSSVHFLESTEGKQMVSGGSRTGVLRIKVQVWR